MRVTVLLFAQLAEALGVREMEVDLEVDPGTGATVGNLLDQLASEHAAIAALDGRLAVAVDERYARRESPLAPGQTVALIPPVSGG